MTKNGGWPRFTTVTYRRRSGDFLDFAVADAGSADLYSFRSAVDHGANPLQIHVPAPLRYVVSMANTVAELRPAPTNFTILSHKTGISFDLRTLIVPVPQILVQPALIAWQLENCLKASLCSPICVIGA